MLTWIGYIGPGLALVFGGTALAQQPGFQNAGAGLAFVGIVYLLAVAPIYKRRRRARLRARMNYDVERYGESYKRRLPRS